MAQKKVKATHPVIAKMLDSLAELDKATAVDGKGQQAINQIRQKIENVTAFAAANLPSAIEENKEGN